MTFVLEGEGMRWPVAGGGGSRHTRRRFGLEEDVFPGLVNNGDQEYSHPAELGPGVDRPEYAAAWGPRQKMHSRVLYWVPVLCQVLLQTLGLEE